MEDFEYEVGSIATSASGTSSSTERENNRMRSTLAKISPNTNQEIKERLLSMETSSSDESMPLPRSKHRSPHTQTMVSQSQSRHNPTVTRSSNTSENEALSYASQRKQDSNQRPRCDSKRQASDNHRPIVEADFHAVVDVYTQERKSPSSAMLLGPETSQSLSSSSESSEESCDPCDSKSSVSSSSSTSSSTGSSSSSSSSSSVSSSDDELEVEQVQLDEEYPTPRNDPSQNSSASNWIGNGIASVSQEPPSQATRGTDPRAPIPNGDESTRTRDHGLNEEDFKQFFDQDLEDDLSDCPTPAVRPLETVPIERAFSVPA